jgi:large subunit ribosomal protein L17
MRHQKAGRKFGRNPSQRKALFRQQAISLIMNERITTTEAKAKAVRGLAEHMVTLAKREDLHARRQVLSMVPDAAVVGTLFDTIAARFSDRRGGYTRIIKLKQRRGDNAPLVLLELVDRPEDGKERKSSAEKKEKAPKGEAGAARGKRKKEKAAAASA